MPDDIAILDQLRDVEIFQCIGRLPATMNYLSKLRILKIRSCHSLNMSLLTLSSLKEIDVTDSENVVPSSFANLTHLERIRLYRAVTSDVKTHTIGHDWVQDLAHPAAPLRYSSTLKDITFCSAGLTNSDLATLLVHVTVPAKFPNLLSVRILRNWELTSFRPAMELWKRHYPPPYQPVPTLQTLSFSNARIPKTADEMKAIIRFLQTYRQLGSCNLFSRSTLHLPRHLAAFVKCNVFPRNVESLVKQINYLSTINRAGGPTLVTCHDFHEEDAVVDGQERVDATQQNRRPRRALPLAVWPIVLERASRLDYVSCFERETASRGEGAENDRLLNHALFRSWNVVDVVAQVRAMLGERPRVADAVNNNINQNVDEAEDDVDDDEQDGNPDAQPGSDLSEDESDTVDSGETDFWVKHDDAYSTFARYDAVYYLLRNSPAILSNGGTGPGRRRRRRSFIPRLCKRLKLF
jgi:hypothetical protein